MIRIGVDFGGTKIEAAALDREGRFLARVRAPNPGNYDAALETVNALVREAEQGSGETVDGVGVAIPGSLSPRTGLVRGANSTWLNDRPFDQDLARHLGRPVRMTNDANCFSLSEAVDGAAAGASSVFGVIIGTGVGGGLVVEGRLQNGRNHVAGEWGHAPLPWQTKAEFGARTCWCGHDGCIEQWLSGPAFLTDYHQAGGAAGDTQSVVEEARRGESIAMGALARYTERLGRALAMVGDIFDPDVIVLGGGMSNVDEIYDLTPPHMAHHLFSDVCNTRIVRARYGDSSGVRGAAWLWPWPQEGDGDGR